MAKKKPRKRPYVQPPNEAENARPRPSSGKRPPQRGRGPQRQMPEPTFARVMRRAPWVFIVFLLIAYIFSDVPAEDGAVTRLSVAAIQATFMTVLFIPLSYFLDRMLYRSVQRRTAQANQAQPDASDAEADADAEDDWDDDDDDGHDDPGAGVTTR